MTPMTRHTARWVFLCGLVAAGEAAAAPPAEPDAPQAASAPSEAPSAPSAGPRTGPAPVADAGAVATPTIVDRLDPKAPLDDATRLRLFQQADQRMAAVRRAEAELTAREARLAQSMRDLERRYQALRTLQDELSKTLVIREKAKDERKQVDEVALKAKAEVDRTEETLEAERRREAIERLSSVFEKMKPAEIAKVVPEMDEGLVVEVLQRLKEKTTARILGALPPPTAARLAEKLARLRKSAQVPAASQSAPPAPAAEAAPRPAPATAAPPLASKPAGPK